MLADHIGVPQLRDLASRSEQIRESIGLGKMTRLAELLFDSDTQADRELEVQIDLLAGMQGFPEISGQVKGSLDICCQRCLGSLVWPVEIDFHLVIVGSETDYDEVAEPFDTLVAGEHGVSLTSIIEDELIASLPLAPMHPGNGVCEITATTAGKAEEKAVENQESGESAESEVHRPFANLDALMKDDEGAD
jgi:uncharacterized protein